MRVHVILSWEPDLVGRLARLFGVKWSHAALLFHPHSEIKEEYVIEALWRGIVKRTLTEFLKDKHDWVILTPLRDGRWPLQYSEINAIRDYAHGNIGKRYDFGLLLRLIWRELKRKVKPSIVMVVREVCTSLIDDSFSYVDWDLIPWKVDRMILPDDLYESPHLHNK